MKPILPKHINEEDSELLIAYLRDELTPPEKAAVESRIKADPEFKELFLVQIKLRAAARASHLEAKLQMLREHAASQLEDPVLPYEKRHRLPRVAAFACLAVAVAGLLWMVIPQKHERLFQAHFSNSIVPPQTELSAEVNMDAGKAFDYYAREQYEKSARAFDKLIESSSEVSEFTLYAAVSHLGAGHLRHASDLLDDCQGNLPGFETEIVKLGILLLVRRGDLEEAKDMIAEHATIRDQDNNLKELYADLMSGS